MQSLYIARVETGGHIFEAVDVLPSLARARLFRELEAFKGGQSMEANRAADRATIQEVKPRTFRRYNAGESI